MSMFQFPTSMDYQNGNYNHDNFNYELICSGSQAVRSYNENINNRDLFIYIAKYNLSY